MIHNTDKCAVNWPEFFGSLHSALSFAKTSLLDRISKLFQCRTQQNTADPRLTLNTTPTPLPNPASATRTGNHEVQQELKIKEQRAEQTKRMVLSTRFGDECLSFRSLASTATTNRAKLPTSPFLAEAELEKTQVAPIAITPPPISMSPVSAPSPSSSCSKADSVLVIPTNSSPVASASPPQRPSEAIVAKIIPITPPSSSKTTASATHENNISDSQEKQRDRKEEMLTHRQEQKVHTPSNTQLFIENSQKKGSPAAPTSPALVEATTKPKSPSGIAKQNTNGLGYGSEEYLKDFADKLARDLLEKKRNR